MTFNEEQFASLQPYEAQMQSALKANYGYIDSAKAKRVHETLTAAGVPTPRLNYTCGWCVMRLLKLAGKHYFADKAEREATAKATAPKPETAKTAASKAKTAPKSTKTPKAAKTAQSAAKPAKQASPKSKTAKTTKE